MNREFERYIDKIIDNMEYSGKIKKQIREDLYISLTEKQEDTNENNPYKLLGNPEDVSKDFIENFDEEIIEKNNTKNVIGYEYKSKTKIFGIPLIHIDTKKNSITKGIISVGGIAIGVFSFGGISFGFVGFGGVSINLIASMGGLAMSLGLSIGGASVSYLVSIGAFALSKIFAFGAMAIADIAIGEESIGIIAIFRGNGSGNYKFQIPVNIDKVLNTVKLVHPKFVSLTKFILRYINF